MNLPKYTIRMRNQREVNTDPQRRCYNGVHARSEMQWTPWVELELNKPAEKVEARLLFWRELNDYAVSERGESARAEFEAVEEVPDEPNP